MDYAGMKVLVMGLGLHGGGLESARFLIGRGAEVTVTDLRDEKTLAPSVEQLEAACAEIPGRPSVRYVLGKHETSDFAKADMVIKNPGVRPDSPYLQTAKRIETDISLFLTESPARLTAVTGSKGKSSTASAIYWGLKMGSGERSTGALRGCPPLRGEAEARRAGAGGETSPLFPTPHSPLPTPYLGGNITVSPLVFLDKLREGDDVVLELSSWQLGDLKGRCRADTGAPLLKPNVAVITAIMPDHLDRYGTMEAYVADKRIIYQGQDSDDFTVAKDDGWGRGFLEESKGRPLIYSEAPLPEGIGGGWLENGRGLARLCGGETVELVPAETLVPGYHQKQNLLAAGLALLGLGLPADKIREGLGAFPGVEHRLEMFHKAGGVEFYNDSAATIPEAAAAAVEALGGQRLVLVTGGTDKNLNFSPLVQAAKQVKTVILLAGTAGEKLASLLSSAGIAFLGPFDKLDAAVAAALEKAEAGDRVVLSPGCASFGMFLNEHDRGRKWKEAVKKNEEFSQSSQRTQSPQRGGKEEERQ
jgi:UDP-N-acetylmuramoylalanine--D-glutamate ligase